MSDDLRYGDAGLEFCEDLQFKVKREYSEYLAKRVATRFNEHSGDTVACSICREQTNAPLRSSGTRCWACRNFKARHGHDKTTPCGDTHRCNAVAL